MFFNSIRVVIFPRDEYRTEYPRYDIVICVYKCHYLVDFTRAGQRRV